MRRLVLLLAFSLSLPLAGCSADAGKAVVEALGQAAMPVAHAEKAPADLWKERGPNDPLPPGFTPMASLAPLVKTLKPGVVNISTTQVVHNRFGRGSGDPFEDFWRNFNGVPQESRRQSLGSGFIISTRGFVITNNHVIDDASEIKVKLADGREFDAELVGRDAKTDVALIKLKGGDLKDLPLVPLGNSDATEVGDFVVAVGNPFGLDQSVSLGIVSAKERVIGAGPYDDFIQTDAAINPGNSGGPLFNTRGEVVGVNTAIVAQGQGIGFAVPINMVKELLPQLVEKGHAIRGWLGVSIQDIDPALARTLKLEQHKGALVAGVMKGSPAETAGLKPRDVVVAVNGKRVDNYNQLLRFVAFIPPGSRANLTVLREGREKNVDVTVGTRPDEDEGEEQQAPQRNAPQADRLGLSVAPLPAQKAQQLGVDGGVLVTSVNADGPAAKAGARPGDVIIEVQRQPVRSVDEYREAMGALHPGDMALVRLQRAQASIYIAVRVNR